MNDERFEQLLGAYGGAHARWPDAERADALRYLAATPGAHAARAAAQALDRSLDAWTAQDVSAGLRDRVRAGQPRARVLRPRTLWISGVGLAAACVLGVMVGAQFGQASLHGTGIDRDTDAAVTAALDSSADFTPRLDQEWS